MNESILFAEWVAENHYRLYNVVTKTGIREWQREGKKLKSTKELFNEYEKQLKSK
jgi:hypothetical protein